MSARVRAVWRWLLVLLLVAAFAVQATRAALTLSATSDEPEYLAAGRALIASPNWRMRDEILHPPLLYYVSGLAQRLTPTEASAKTKLVWARLAMLPFALLLGLYVEHWARRKYGGWAGVLALFLFAFSPTILAFAPLAVTDLLLAAFFVPALYHFEAYVDAGRWRDAALAGLFLGLALLAKYTALLLVPILLVGGILRMPRQPGERVRFAVGIVATLALGLLVLQLGYGLPGPLATPAPPGFASRFFERLRTLGLIDVVRVLLPAPFTAGLDQQLSGAQNGYPGFFLGMRGSSGWWYYHPLAFLLKTPLPLLVLLAMAAILPSRPARRPASVMFLILPALLTLAYFSLFSKVSGSVRYLLPLWGLVFVAAGRVVTVRMTRLRFAVAGSLLAAYAAGSLSVHPHYLAYANLLAGGPANSFRVFGGSDLDWAQYGYLLPGIPVDSTRRFRAAGCFPAPGRYGLQSNRLQGVFSRNDCFRWLRDFEPSGSVGFAYLIYDLDLQDFRRRAAALPGDAAARAALGWVLFSEGDTEGAQRELDEAVRLAPSYGEAATMRGILRFSRGDYYAALEDFQRAAAIEPTVAKPRSWAALAWDALGEPELADAASRAALRAEILSGYDRKSILDEAAYQGLVAQDPRNPKWHSNLGVLLWLEGKPEAALEEMRLAVDLCGHCGAPWYNRAFVLGELGRQNEARESLLEAAGLWESAGGLIPAEISQNSPERPTVYNLDDWLTVPWFYQDGLAQGVSLPGYAAGAEGEVSPERALRLARAHQPLAAMRSLLRAGGPAVDPELFQSLLWQLEYL